MIQARDKFLLIAAVVGIVAIFGGAAFFYLRRSPPPPDQGESIENDVQATNHKLAMQAYAEANQALAERSFEAAIAGYSRALELEDGLIPAYVGRGNAQLALMQYDEAIAQYDLAIFRDPTCSSAYFARGTVNWLLGQLSQAEKDYKKSVVLQPNESLYYSRLATVLKELKKADEVEKLYESAYQLDHDKDWALMGWLNEFMESERYAQVVQICENLRPDVAEDHPSWRAISLYSGIAHLRLKDYEAAIPELETVVQTDPDGLGFSAYEALAEAYRATGDVKACKHNVEEYSHRLGRQTVSGWCEERSTS